jgi:hypothetical protein
MRAIAPLTILTMLAGAALPAPADARRFGEPTAMDRLDFMVGRWRGRHGCSGAERCRPR